jgi:ABC-type dipeptide/oligopeptide/nickel transport system permease subunit
MSKGEEKKRSKRFKVGIGPAFLIMAIFVITALFADLLAPYDPTEMNLAESLTPPWFQHGGTLEHLLGTDILGRDILSRLIYGARVSLIVGLLGVGASFIIGGGMGIIAGYRGGFWDTLIARSADVMLGFPTIMVALILAVTIVAKLCRSGRWTM